MTLWAGSIDVGWGQACTHMCSNLILNPNIEMNNETNPINGGGEYSFQNGYVGSWFSAYNSPHHIQYRPSLNPPECDYGYATSNNTEITCLATHTTGYFEGIYCNAVPGFYDPLESFCLTFDAQRLKCSDNYDYKIIVKLASELTNYPISEPDIYLVPANTHQLLGEHIINSGAIQTINHSFNGGQFEPNYYDQILIHTENISNVPPPQMSSFTTINNVKLTCTTDALEGIETIQQNENTYKFTAIYNSLSFHDIASYFWEFGDGSTSTEAMPVHTFLNGGPYNVCLSIVNVNGCCAKEQIPIEIEVDPPTCGNLTNTIKIGNNPNSAITLSSLLGTSIPFTLVNNVKTITNQYFHLNANLVMDDRVKLVGCEWFIESGSQITLNRMLEMDDTDFQSCNNLWRGIVVNNQLIRMRNNCEIRDAENALTLSNRSNIDIMDCRFINNYRGIYAPGSVQKTIGIIGSGQAIVNNAFIFENTSLFPQYVGQVEYNSQARSGVEIENVSNFNITGGRFENLLFGIHNKGSRSIVNSVDFEDKRQKESTGIFIQNGSTRNKVTNGSSFKNLMKSIEIFSTNFGVINIENSSFFNDRTTSNGIFGIKVANSIGSEVYISNVNNFNFTSGLGIQITNSNLKVAKIDDNNFTTSGEGHQAIFLNSLKTSVNIVNNNRFNYSGSTNFTNNTVNLQEVNYLEFTNNNVIGITTGHQKAFVSVGAVTNSVFKNNVISNHPKGFDIIYGQPNSYCCNISSTPLGDNFHITGLSGSTIVQNTFNSFTFDAMSSSKMGNQPNHGNVWAGAGQNATMENGNSIKALGNQFLFDPNQIGGVPKLANVL